MNEDIFSIEKNREIRKLQEKIERDWVLRKTNEDKYELEIDEEDLESIIEDILIRREKKNRELLKEIIDLLEDIKVYLRRLQFK
jgi:hypothetical protein